MTKAIEVGERVREASDGEEGRVLALHTAEDGTEWAWVEWDSDHDCFGAKTKHLTRIEPEPVTLTVKYPPGTEVCLRQDRLRVFTVEHVDILYRDPIDNSRSWYQDSLEPCDCAKCSSE